ncbi:unnamed protein product [Ixodes persulcatus]
MSATCGEYGRWLFCCSMVRTTADVNRGQGTRSELCRAQFWEAVLVLEGKNFLVLHIHLLHTKVVGAKAHHCLRLPEQSWKPVEVFAGRLGVDPHQALLEQVLEGLPGPVLVPRQVPDQRAQGRVTGCAGLSDERRVVQAQLRGHRLDQVAGADGDEAEAFAQRAELLDGPEQVVLADFLLARQTAAGPGHPVPELLEAHEATIAVTRGQAHLDHLDAELVVEVSHAQHVCPEALAGRERVDPRCGAHLLELASEVRVLADLVLVLGREGLQLGPEGVHLPCHLLQLFFGQFRALVFEPRLRQLLLLDGSDAAHSSPHSDRCSERDSSGSVR